MSVQLSTIKIMKSEVDLTNLSDKKFSADCTFTTTIGMPKDTTQGQIKCIVDVAIGDRSQSGIYLRIKSVSLFETDGDDASETLEIECERIAMSQTAKKIEDLVQFLVGTSFSLPVPDID